MTVKIKKGLVASAAYTATGNSGSVNTPDFYEGIIYLNVTAVSGTSPTLDITIQDSLDASTWFTHTAFTQKTATGTDVKRISQFGPFIRILYTIGGTSPSFTFSVDGTFWDRS